jgi:hypothetical protein
MAAKSAGRTGRNNHYTIYSATLGAILRSITFTIIAAIAALVLSACSLGQPSGPLTVKGFHLGMGRAELEEAARVNGWSVKYYPQTVKGRSTVSLTVGYTQYGEITFDEAEGIIYFRLNTAAFEARDLSYRDFVESLQAAYPIGELQQAADFGNCGRWEGTGPAGEWVSTTNCGEWSMSVRVGAEQSGATFN